MKRTKKRRKVKLEDVKMDIYAILLIILVTFSSLSCAVMVGFLKTEDYKFLLVVAGLIILVCSIVHFIEKYEKED